jgi:hypothetical protein
MEPNTQKEEITIKKEPWKVIGKGVLVGVIILVIGFLIGRGTAPTIKLSDEATYHEGFMDGRENQKQIDDYEYQINHQATTTILEEKQRCDKIGGKLDLWGGVLSCKLPEKNAFEYEVK